MTDEELRAIWRKKGGSFHGPRVETGTMPEEKLLPFLRELLGGNGEHTHKCVQCFKEYTPIADATTEDCPACGCNGTMPFNAEITGRPVDCPVIGLEQN